MKELFNKWRKEAAACKRIRYCEHVARREMGLTEDLVKKIDYAAKYYGLDWCQTPAGMLISNGVEYWLLKFKKEKVRKLLHQNHGRTGKIIPLPCDVQELDNAIVQKFFHTQEQDEHEIKEICCYISNHGYARRKLMRRQSAVLAAFS